MHRSISALTCSTVTPGCGRVSTRITHSSGIIEGPPGGSPP